MTVVSRRMAMAGLMGGAMSVWLAGCSRGGAADPQKTDGQAGVPAAEGTSYDPAALTAALALLEDQAKGRLGAFIFDPARAQGFGWRQDERFSMCSTFKLSLAAMVLSLADAGQADLGKVLTWSQSDLVSHSPVTSQHVAGGLTVQDIARAALVASDNTAANVLLREFGGPQAMTRFWRGMGDDVSRLDRFETDLNDTPAGSEYDTTTPAAMARTVSRLLLGEVLSAASRTMLTQWMVAVETGLDRIRAGFPADWVAGDKTGTGFGSTRHTYADLAFGGPKGRTPLIVTAWFEPTARIEPRDPGAIAALARVGQLAAGTIATPPAQALLIHRTGLF